MIAYFVGATGSGKTYLACKLAVEDAASTHRPLVIIDSEGVVPAGTGGAVLVDNPGELPAIVWREGHSVRFVPDGPEDVGRVACYLRGGKNAVLLVDEISYWGRGAHVVPELARLFRVHRHSNVSIYATSQYPGDISPLIWNIRTHVYVFRNDSMRAMERLTEELSLSDEDVDAIRSLPDREYKLYGRSLRPAPEAAAQDAPESASPTSPAPPA